MAIKCPQCGAEYDVTLFTFGRRIRCDFGAWVDLAVGHQQASVDGNRTVQHAPPGSTEHQIALVGLCMLAPNLIFGLHGGMFDLSPHELNIIHYSGMAFLKLVVICFFFFPWAAIKSVLR